MIKEQIQNITIYNNDYKIVACNYPDKYFDIVYDDPPWGIGADNPSLKNKTVQQKNGTHLNIKQSSYHRQHWHKNTPNEEYFDIILKKSKEQIIWGVNYFNKPLPGGRIIWDKLNGNSDQFDGEIAYCSLHNRIDILYYRWQGMIQGVYCGRDIKQSLVQQGNKKLNERRRHPTQKPLILEKYIISKYTKPGDTIFVPHGGSLNTAIVCMYLNRKCVICEIDSIHYQNGLEAIYDHQKIINWNKRQLSLEF